MTSRAARFVHMKPAVSRLVRAVLIGVAALYAVYLTGVNVFLSTRLFERLVNRAPETIWIHFERAWSLFPGRIHARGLQIRARDSMVEWFLEIGTVDFDVSMTGLLRKRFVASHVDADQVGFRLRNRLATEPTSDADYAELPPLPGLGPFGVTQPPILDAGDWDDAYYHLWTVDLEDVDARDVREVWADKLRFAGRARVQGRFLLKPLRILEVGPAAGSISEGTVGRGPRTMVQALAGSFTYTLARLDPRSTGSKGALYRSRIETDLRATVVDGGVLVDVPRLVVRLDHGVVMAGSRVDAAGVVRRGAERVTAAVIAEAGTTGLHFRAVGTLDTPGLDLSHASVVGELSGLALGDPVRAIDAVVTGSGRLTSAPWSVRADADGKLRLVVWQLVPRTFVLERLQAALSDVRVRGPGLEAALASVEVAGRHIVQRGGAVTLEHGKVTAERGAGKVGGRPFALARARLEVASPRFDLGQPALRGADLHVDIEGAVLDDAAGLRALFPDLPLERGRVALAARFDLRASDKTGSGSADLALDDAAMRAGSGRVTGDAHAHLGIHAYQAATQEVDLSGSQVTLYRVAAQGKTSWRGQLTATGALLRLDGAPALDAQVDLRATDASLFLAALSDKIPGILIGLLRMPDLHATATLSVAKDKLDVEHVDARGGNVRVHGDYRADGDRKQGEFVVKKGVIPVNLKIDKAGVHVTVLKGSTARDR